MNFILNKICGEVMLSKDFENIQQLILEENRQLEEKIVKDVLKDFLGRIVTFDDAKRVTKKQTIGVLNKYVLSFDDVDLGTVVTENIHSNNPVDVHYRHFIRFIPNANFR